MTVEPRSLVGQVLTDTSQRVLRIDEVNPGEPLGREIVGTLLGHRSHKPYATTFATFREVWIERMPPVSREQQELNRKKLGV